MPSRTVLCVDSDDGDRRETARRLHEVASTVLTADSGSAARSIQAEQRIDCLVTEYDIGDETGFALVEHLRSRQPDAAAIVYTGAGRDAIRTGTGDVVVDYLDKGATDALDRLATLVAETVDQGSQRLYPVPDRESARLAALAEYDLTDPSLRSALDRIADLATAHFDRPLASVNVVGEYDQTFLVCRGADWSGTDRRDSVCTYTILEPGVTVVEDVQADPRFESVDELREMGIRFYAGVPLRTPGGDPVATLCVYDREPGSFAERDREYLAMLGALAEDLIAAHHGADVPISGSDAGVEES